MKSSPFSTTWNLDSLYPGGSRSEALGSKMKRVKQSLAKFQQKFKQLSDLKKGILHYQELDGECRDLMEFIGCLLAQDVNDTFAVQLQSQMVQLSADCDSIGEEVNALLFQLDEPSFTSLISDPEIAPIRFHLEERRKIAQEKLSSDQEKLIHALSVNGYQGWHSLYSNFVGQLKIHSPFPSEKPLSVGQAENKLSDPDRNIRQAWFKVWKETWQNNEQTASQILNHLGGFRLNVYQARGWPSVIKEPLFYNRMSEETLDTMWHVVKEQKAFLLKYLKAKAASLKLDKLSWVDLDAPSPSTHQSIPYQQGAELIIRAFHDFSPSMGAFAKHAFESKWIEAENRPDKRPGGFCVSFGQAKESQVFMTYSGTMNNVFTLAHELGHAYHSDAVKNMPIFAQQYRMNVAETASTIAETIVIDSMIGQEKEKQNRIALLDNKLQRAVIFLMNIHARYLFELDFYHARRKHFVSAEELNALMLKAQKTAYHDALGEWNPQFWISKQHFYITDVPFYNFPYTFGYLFSQGIYTHLKHNPNRDTLYKALLEETGSLMVEDLASKHLGVNLKEPTFWIDSLKGIKQDVEAYT